MRRLSTNCDGNVAMIFALVTPLLMAAVGIGIDFQARLAQKTGLQDAADGLALRGAREMLLENAQDSTIEALILALAEKQYGPTLGQFSTSPIVDHAAASATVTVTQPSKNGFFLSQLVPHEDPIVVHATAVAKGVTNVCIIILEEQNSDALYADLNSKITAPKCAILSNSTSTTGIHVLGLAKLSAKFICSSGGVSGNSLNFDPQPLLDCPKYSDPLSGRTPPTVGACDYNNSVIGDPKTKLTKAEEDALAATMSIIDGAMSGTLPGYTRYDLQPGVYCGGLEIASMADVHLAPGTYIIKGGKFLVDKGARVIGDNVGFYFSGGAPFDFARTAIIHLTAPKSGLMAGLLFWEASDAPAGKAYKIKSANARELLGTIYLKKGILQIESENPIADQSAYTAIVVNTLRMSVSPTVYLNTNYGATDIPAPEGVGPTGGMVFLRE